jgi:hypothetical protein
MHKKALCKYDLQQLCFEKNVGSFHKIYAKIAERVLLMQTKHALNHIGITFHQKQLLSMR